MSFKSNSIKNNSKTNNSVQINEEMNELRETVSKCIDEDLPLLKPFIDLSEMSQLMPDLKKIGKKESISESEISSKLNEMNQKIDKLVQNKSDSELNIGSNESDLDLVIKSSNQLEIQFPSFKRIANTLTENFENNSINEINCFDRRVIEVNDHNVDKLLLMSRQMLRFYESQRHFNAFKD